MAMEPSSTEETHMLERLISQLNVHMTNLGPVGELNAHKLRGKI